MKEKYIVKCPICSGSFKYEYYYYNKVQKHKLIQTCKRNNHNIEVISNFHGTEIEEFIVNGENFRYTEDHYEGKSLKIDNKIPIEEFIRKIHKNRNLF